MNAPAQPPIVTPAATAPRPESLETQLVQLNERVRMHAQRLWQLPFAYLGVIGILVTANGNGAPAPKLFWAIFAALGLVVAWSMVGCVAGIYRGVSALANVEKLLHLPHTAQASPIAQYWPYFAVLFAAIGLAASAAL